MHIKIQDAIIGFIVGDALGVPVEFESRESLKINPVKDMREYGTYHQPKGTWSDDTSMTLCSMESLVNGLDYNDLMDKFSNWMKSGYMTARNEVFDIGIGTQDAIHRFLNGTDALSCGGKDEFDNGNGSLMRMLPVAFYTMGIPLKSKLTIKM